MKISVASLEQVTLVSTIMWILQDIDMGRLILLYVTYTTDPHRCVGWSTTVKQEITQVC